MTLSLALLVLAASPVQVEPAALTFGPEPTAAIVLVVPGAKSVSAVSANGVGAISAPERLADGKFKARFTFPAERFPQLALLKLEIEADGGAKSRQWVALPLIANAHLKIETKPRAAVSVTIGAKTFGPATADAKGKVTIPAQVPPGFATATVLAVDRAGNQTTRPLDLQPRPFARAAGALAAEEASADLPVPLEIFAVEPDGRPLARAEGLTLSAKLGSLEPPSAKADGVFLSSYRVPKAIAPSDVISIGVEGTPAVTRLEVKLRAGTAARLVLTLTPPTFTAGAGQPSRVQVSAVDANGNPTAMDKPAFTTDFGQLEATPDGLMLRVPDAFAGRSSAVVAVTASGARGEASLGLLAAAPSKAELTFPPRLSAGQTEQGQVRVTDRFGNPVEKAKVEGVLLPQQRTAVVKEAGEGRYDLTLAVDSNDSLGEGELQLTANGVPVGKAALMVRHPLRRWAFSLGALGFVQTNFGQWVSGGPRVTLGLRVGGTGLEVIAEGAYGVYAPILGAQSADGSGAGFNVELKHLSVGLGARYWFAVGARGALHLSILVGLQNTGSTVTRRDTPLAKLSDQSLGGLLRGGGGVGYYLGIGRLVAQLEYTLAPGGGLVRGNMGGAGLSLGYVASF